MNTTNTLRRFRILKWVPRILMLGVVGFSAYVYFHYDENKGKGPGKREKEPRRPVIAETNLVEFTQMDSGMPIYHVKAKRRKQFRSTSQELIDPEFTFFDKEGAETIHVRGKECRIAKEMNTITVSGGTVVRSANGMKVEAEQMKYDSRQQKFSTEDPAHFKWQTMQGWSKGFVYEIDTQTLILPQNPEIRYINKGSDNTKPIVMIGDRGRVERMNGFAYFEGNVLVTQGQDRVKADRIEAYYEPGGNTIQKITAMNNVKIKFGRPAKDEEGEEQPEQPEQPKPSVPSGRQTPSMGNVFSAEASSGKDLEAELVEIHFYEDGATIRDFHAEDNCTFVLHTFGKNNKPVENRIIKGDTFDAKFNQLSDMEEFHAMENVSVKLEPLHKKQTQQSSQTIFCNDLVATFVPQTGDIKEIHFDDGFKHVQEKRTVSSDRAVYYGNLKKTDLIGKPEIDDPSFRIQSKDMELFEETSGIHAKGQVKSQFVRSEGKTPMTFPFSSPSNQPVYISSEIMDWDAQKSEAVYTDKAKLWQEKNVITADKIIINDKEKTLSAEQKVHTIFYNKKDQKKPKEETKKNEPQSQSQPSDEQENFLLGGSTDTDEGPISVDAGIMNYVEKDRIIHFEKTVKIVTPSTKINSEKADFYLKEESSEFDRLYAQEKVQIEHEQKKGNGNYATFFNDERKLILEGQPRLAEAGKADITGHVLTLFLADGRILIDGEEDGRATTTLQMEGSTLATPASPKSATKSPKDSPASKPGKGPAGPKPAKAPNKKVPNAAPKNRKPD